MIQGVNEADEITGLLVDHGSLMQFSIRDIQLLPDSLRSLPKQAHVASLHDIQPLADQWSDQEISTFRQMVMDKTFVVKIMRADEVKLYVRLIDTSASTDDEDKDVDIASLLIQRQVGRPTAGPAA